MLARIDSFRNSLLGSALETPGMVWLLLAPTENLISPGTSISSSIGSSLSCVFDKPRRYKLEHFCESPPANVWVDTWRRAGHRPLREESRERITAGTPFMSRKLGGTGRLGDVTSV